jgi:dienelactone hydrolase
LATVLGANAQTRVEPLSLDRHQGAPLALVGHWFAAPGEGSRPAVLLLHGCGGAYDGPGALSTRLRDYAAMMNAEGWHALVLDSLTPRGERELCTQRVGSRQVTQRQRRLDALGALDWLAQRPEVDAARLALVGWSNGGSTVLAATNRLQADVAQAPNRARAAVAFYPGCATELARGHASTVPMLLLVGERDDWTEAAPCVELAARSAGQVRTVVYPDAFHGFDGTAPLRLRREVPNGAKPGQGVTVGGNPAAREASQRELRAFLGERLAP